MPNQIISILCLSALLPFGCANMNKTQKGATAGAIVGGVVGGASKGGKGAAIGAAAGAAAGGLLGNYLDRRQKELAQVVKTEKTADGLLITLKNDVLFDFNKSNLKSGSQETLADLAQILAKYPKDKLRVAGFTDHIGAADYNKKLSAERAESVTSFLASNGVKNKMTAVGMGEIPGTGNDPSAVANHRKVEIYIDVAPPSEN
ncbi:MAG TPA: OmpA family protein [Pseudobdellovibrionaceae bacterium]|nr:OmpA family protein [Pseudobdellovibrionaceae bacterium]